MRFMRFKWLWLLISVITMIPGIISFMLYGLELSIDFTGGSLIEVSGNADTQAVKKVVERLGVSVVSVQQSDEKNVLVRMKTIDEPKHKEIKDVLAKELKVSENRFETVGPSVSKDITNKAFLSVGVAILAIVFYVAWAFRKVPKPASPWRFGVTTIFAMIHDVIVLVGAFSLLGHFFGIEVDSLFVTAALTVLGFSVHDTIVVYDRVRENLRRHASSTFEEVVDISMTETFARSLNTSFTVMLVLASLVIFGGASIRPFMLALLIGIFSGTYSSIFNASPLLVYWQNWSDRRGR